MAVQYIPGDYPDKDTGVLTSSGSVIVPSWATGAIVDASAAGGGNGLGQASAATAGGGGGGAGASVRGFTLSVTGGSTLTYVVGAGVANSAGGSTTITGAGNAFPALNGGSVGAAGAAGAGGAGGNGGGPNGGAGGAAGVAGGVSAAIYPNWGGLYVPGTGGGGGGNAAGAAGSGATGSLFTPALTPGAGNGAGGGGGASMYGNGGVGGIGGSPGIAPTTGFGGGAGGSGTNDVTTVAGKSGFVRIRFV